MKQTDEWGEALERCASEKIHLINQVQAAAVLLVLDERSGSIVQVSANAAELFDAPEQMVGCAAGTYFREEALEGMRTRLQRWAGRGPTACELETTQGTWHLGWAHIMGKHIILELPVRRRRSVQGWERQLEVDEAKRRIENTGSLKECLEQSAREVQEFTSFDRVMVYQFRQDGTGEVVAEAVREDWTPYLGLRYPASDIPPQARELFLRNGTRVLVDVSAPPVGLYPERLPDSDEVLDLSLSRYRQPAAVHVKYLGNMGVKGSFVCAIVVSGALWGLVACHHGEPVDLGVEVQMRTGTLLEHLAAHIGLLARQDRLERSLRHAQLSNKVIQSITVTEEWVPSILGLGAELMQAMGATGMAVRFEGESHVVGHVLGAESLDRVAEGMLAKDSDQLVFTDRISDHPKLAGEASGVVGMLAARLSRFQDDALLFFRPEEVREVRWGGEPTKGLAVQGGESRLEPRASFAEWVETVKGRSAQWGGDELELAENLATTLTDIVISAYYLRRELVGDQMARLRLSHESDPNPLMLADGRGAVVYCNPAADRWLKKSYSSIEEVLSVLQFAEGEEVERSLHEMVKNGTNFAATLAADGADSGEQGRALQISALKEEGRLVGFVIHVTDGA